MDNKVARNGILRTALAPLLPQVFGSAFNIGYNAVVIRPLLTTPALEHRFFQTVFFFNLVVFPLAVGVWLWLMFSLRGIYARLRAGEPVEAARLDAARHRVVHLPWLGAAVSGVAWLLCVPGFLFSLAQVVGPLGSQLMWHLPISFGVSAFIAITQSFFTIELASQRELFPIFFRGVRPDRLEGFIRSPCVSVASCGPYPWAPARLSRCSCSASRRPRPIRTGSRCLVGVIGIVFGLWSAVLISQLVATPVDELRVAAQAVSEGRYDVSVPLRRADEFGALIGEFNSMVAELREKARLREMFGLHVGPKAAEQILARDPGLSGREQIITVMFVDIRSFTARAAASEARRVVQVLNEFLGAMVEAVEAHHTGMVNKFLGDGFIALFGAGVEGGAHADEALQAAKAMLLRLENLNTQLGARGEAPLAIGIGLHTGPAIVGSIGSPQRLEFTAIGSTVNLASRIEALTKAVGATILLSDATRLALQRPVELRELPPQVVKGVATPVLVWEPAGNNLS